MIIIIINILIVLHIVHGTAERYGNGGWIDADRLGAVVCLVDTDQSVSQLKHVVT